MERYYNKVAVVTGASGGIGGEIAQHLVKHGLQVVGLGRNKEKLKEVLKRSEGQTGKFHPYITDLTKEEEIVKAFQWIKDNLGPVHVLVNAAGIGRIGSLGEDGNAWHWKEVFDTNVLGLCICTKEALKDMKDNNVAGHIIHMNSIAGHNVLAIPKTNVYSASKYAVTALTESLRQELNQTGSKIKVTSISPGIVKTEIFRKSWTNSGLEDAEKGTHFTTLFPYLNPEDVADAVIYVLGTPPHVQVHELMLKPIGEAFTT